MRRIAIMVTMILLVLGGVANLSAGGQGEGPSMDGGGDADEKVTIRVLTRWSGTDSRAEIWQQAQQEYMAMNPDVEIIDESVNDEAAYNNKFRTSLATGNMPAIFYVVGTLLQVEYAQNGVILNLEEYFENDPEWANGMNAGYVNQFRFDEYGVPGIYGIPTSGAIEVFYYNTELFDQAGIDGVPETYGELKDTIATLRDAGIVPWGVGAQSTWRAGHIHNILLYKMAGVEKAVQLGINREAEWTDPIVVRSLNELKNLKAMGAFPDNFEAIDYDTEKARFFDGEYGMVFNGTWLIGEVAAAGIDDKIGAFLFPPMEEFPQFSGHNISFEQGFNISANLTPEQEYHAVEFMKFYTSREMQERMVYETQNLPARTDLDLDPDRLSPLFIRINDLSSQIEAAAGDSFSYDPLAAMQDRTRNSIVGMLLGNTAEEAAEEIQNEIDSRSN